MKKKTKQITTIIGIIIAIAILFHFNKQPPLIYQTFEAYYSDGSHETLTPQGYPLTIVDIPNGRTLLSLTTSLYITANYEGPITSYTVTGRTYGNLFNGWNNVFITQLWSSTLPFSGTYLSSGSSTLVAQSTISGSGLQSLYDGWVSGNRYRYTVETPEGFTVTLIFSDGSTLSRTTVPSYMNYYFYYQYP